MRFHRYTVPELRDDTTVTSLAADANEKLENGHHPDTPTGDNLLLEFVRGEAASYGAIVTANGGRTFDDEDLGLHATDLALSTPFGNTAHLGQPVAESSARQLVEQLRSFYSAQPGGPFLLFSPWPTPDLSEHGLAPVGHPPLMFRPAGGTTVGAPGLTISRVTTADGLAEFERTLIEAYPIPEMQPVQRGAFLDPAVLDSRWQFYVGYHDAEPVATAAAFVTDQIAMVELVSTRRGARGKGVGAAITSAAGLAAPGLPAMLIASDLGRNIYTSLGYSSLLRYTLWIGTR